MEAPIVRAFLLRSLNSVQISNLRAYENSLPRGKYLTGLEICQKFQLRPKPVSEDQQEQMKLVWQQFEKILWKDRQIEEKHHEVTCAEPIAEKASWCNCRSYQEELHRWEDYALEHYKDASLEALSY